MRRFLHNAVIFATLQLLVLGAILTLRPQDKNTYLAATLDKHERAQSLNGNRVLLVGGSNVAFGIDSSLVQSAAGRPPVNLALHAGLGVDFILNEAIDVARPGDVVILSLEYEHFVVDTTNHATLDLISHRPHSAAYLSWQQDRQLLDQGLTNIRRRLLHSHLRALFPSQNGKHPDYSRDGFNHFGDVIAHHGRTGHYHAASHAPNDSDAPLTASDPKFVTATIYKLNGFIRRCHRHDIEVVYCHPAIAQSFFEGAQSAICHIDEQLTAQLDCTILNRAGDVVYPDRLFYDTVYHLTQAGKIRRTKALAVALRQREPTRQIQLAKRQP